MLTIKILNKWIEGIIYKNATTLMTTYLLIILITPLTLVIDLLLLPVHAIRFIFKKEGDIDVKD